VDLAGVTVATGRGGTDMSTTTVDDTATGRVRRTGFPLPALAGIGALAAFAGAAVVFGDPMAGASTPAEAAVALAGSRAPLAAVLLGAYALLAIVVVGALAARLARGGDTGAVRLLPVLGAGHVLLLTAAFTAPAAAAVVGTQVLDVGVTPTAAETALLLMNVAHPMAAWVGAAFMFAVVAGARSAGASRVLLVVSAVFAIGLLLPPVGWAVTYLMPLWFAGVGIWLWLRR
jgi:hypothetical protein